MTNERLEALAVWYRERRCRVKPWLCINDLDAYAACVGIEIDLNDRVELFHYINKGKEGQHA